MSYLSLFHSWLNTFSSPSSVFLSPSNLSSFISIFHSFTVGYIFPALYFLSPLSFNLSILISIFLLFTVEIFCSHQGNCTGVKQTLSEDTEPGGERWHHPICKHCRKNWESWCHCQSKVKSGVKLNAWTVKWIVHRLTVMYSEIKTGVELRYDFLLFFILNNY